MKSADGNNIGRARRCLAIVYNRVGSILLASGVGLNRYWRAYRTDSAKTLEILQTVAALTAILAAIVTVLVLI
jgi:hypothetical protein